ncbi:hypothetical protein CDQ73_09520, partial [Campylobacter hyointestinalis subsp. hyointestinalis]
GYDSPVLAAVCFYLGINNFFFFPPQLFCIFYKKKYIFLMFSFQMKLFLQILFILCFYTKIINF